MHHSKSQIKFFEGPQSRWRDFKFTISTFLQLIKGFRTLHFVGPCITFFGSARFKEDHKYYQLTREIASEMAKLGFTIITGGGPGLMEAANKGAKDVGGRSIGCNIKLPKEQLPNPFVDKMLILKYFFIRKILLVKYSYAFIVMPGGYGTMDEYFEALTLIQTKTILDFPVIIFDPDFYGDLANQINKMEKEGTLSAKDKTQFLLTESVEEAVKLVKERCIKNHHLSKEKQIPPLKWLFEKRA